MKNVGPPPNAVKHFWREERQVSYKTADVLATFRVWHACRRVEFTPKGLHNKAQGKPCEPPANKGATLGYERTNLRPSSLDSGGFAARIEARRET